VTRTPPSRLCTLWLFAALVLLLRAAVPAGWMPQADSGGIRIALCSGSGPVELTLAADGTFHRGAPALPGAHDPCPFGLASVQPFDLTAAVAIAPPDYAADRADPLPVPDALAPRADRALRPPTRGPPSLA
jgi:hypothetical protein